MASPWWRWLSPGSAPRSLATLSFQLAGGVVAPGSAIAVLLIVRLALMVAAIGNLRSPTRRASSGRMAAGFRRGRVGVGPLRTPAPVEDLPSLPASRRRGCRCRCGRAGTPRGWPHPDWRAGTVLHGQSDRCRGRRAPGVCRKDLFNDAQEKSDFQRKYGYPLAAPTTWEQFQDVAQFFTRGPKLYGTDVKGAVETEWLAHVLQAGAAGPVLYPSGKVIIDDAQHVATPTFYSNLNNTLKVAPPGATQVDWAAAQNLFNQGKTAMTRSVSAAG